jgi:hypothetical protein
MMPRILQPVLLVVVVGSILAAAESRKTVSKSSLKSLMTVPAGVVMDKTYDTIDASELEAMRSRKATWLLKGGTQCGAEEGALKLSPPTVATANKNAKWSTGWTRAMIRKLPQDYAMSFRFQLLPTGDTKRPPRMFFESGHMKVRINARSDGVDLTVFDTVEKNQKYGVKPGQWQRVFFEARGDEVVMQFENGPTFYRKDKRIAEERIGLQFGVISKAGILLDDLKIWKIGLKTMDGWDQRRKKLIASAGPRMVVTKGKKK